MKMCAVNSWQSGICFGFFSSFDFSSWASGFSSARSQNINHINSISLPFIELIVQWYILVSNVIPNQSQTAKNGKKWKKKREEKKNVNGAKYTVIEMNCSTFNISGIIHVLHKTVITVVQFFWGIFILPLLLLVCFCLL